MQTINQPQLDVCEFNGPGRGGKGTITNAIAENREGVAREETGIDYRLVGGVLLSDGTLELGMDEAKVEETVLAQDPNRLVDILANKAAHISGFGGETYLYSDDVSEITSKVSQVDPVRGLVKAGLARRIEAVRDSGDFRVLLVEGRNLAPVVRSVEGASLLLRTYVHCNVYEGAWRQVNAASVDIASEDGAEFYRKALDTLRGRNKRDRNRSVDPVKPDPENRRYDFWDDMRAPRWNAQDTLALMTEMGADLDQLGVLVQDRPDETHMPKGFVSTFRHAPAYAVEDRVQLFWDTSPYRLSCTPDQSRAAMIAAGLDIFDEALDAALVH